MIETPFTHAKRRIRTPQQRAKIFHANGKRCHKCKRTLGPADWWDLDHRIALENGGTDEDDNLAPCCEWCHDDKTADDHAIAGHGRRRATRHCVPKEFRKGKGWRT